jgi:hypothetical protein
MKGGKKIGKIWRHARALAMCSLRLCSILRTLFGFILVSLVLEVKFLSARPPGRTDGRDHGTEQY